MKILVTGGAGFIGSALIREIINNTNHRIINVDKLTYASNLQALSSVQDNPHYFFAQIDICHKDLLSILVNEHKPDAIIHLAAESHVDRSIIESQNFISSNIVGTYNLLEVACNYWQKLPSLQQKNFRFLHVSTDEVYGELSNLAEAFSESSPYHPNNPYSASKAASDHLVNAWYHTYGFPMLITHCSNNYGPYQYSEKLIPLVIKKALSGEAIPIYGDGSQIRDWIYVEDHVKALYQVLVKGKVGECYNIGSNNEYTNLNIVKKICTILDKFTDANIIGLKQYQDLIIFVTDRKGHDNRYAIDASKIKNDLGWKPQQDFDTGLQKTVLWYLNNKELIKHSVIS